MIRNCLNGLLLIFLLISSSSLVGCGKKEVSVPVVVESRTPYLFLMETPFPDEPDFVAATNADLWNYALELRARLDECNEGKRKALELDEQK